MREIDRLTTERYGIPSLVLMENAAAATTEAMEPQLRGCWRQPEAGCELFFLASVRKTGVMHAPTSMRWQGWRARDPSRLEALNSRKPALMKIPAISSIKRLARNTMWLWTRSLERD